MAAVARAAGVSEPTVYLRHRSKHDLAVAAIAHLPAVADPPDNGDVRRDLIALLDELVRNAAGIGLSVLGTVLAEEPHHPELLERWRVRAGMAMADATRAVLERGRSRGQVRSDADIEATVDLLLGAYLGRYTTRGSPPRGWTKRVVGVLWPHLDPGPVASGANSATTRR